MYIEFEKGQKYANTISDISESHESFTDAGWLLEDNDYVVDIDTLPKDTIKKIIDVFNIKTQIVWTDRGAHFYFKKPSNFSRGANRVSALGFKYEIKHKANTKAITIKRNGKLRDIENKGVREDAPFIFNSAKKFDVLYGMEDGEGRNNALFLLRGKLGGVAEWRKILTFVNQYIFAVPLNDNEFDLIVREMRVDATKGAEYEVAEWLMNDLNFLKYGERYYFKNEDEYTCEKYLLTRKVFQAIGQQKTSYVDEVIKQMEYRSRVVPDDTVFVIKFNNGYLKNGKFVDMQIDDFTPFSIDVDYNPNAKPVKVVDDYINHLTKNDEDYRNLLMEVLGHTLIVDPEFKRLLGKFFIFIGEGGNGKGTLLQIIRQILGSKNVTGLSIKDMSDERYLVTFRGKLANLGDDIQDAAINDKDMKILKNISTCDFISTRELFKQADNACFTGSLIFTSNHLIKSFEKGVSYKRRVMWLPMFTKVKKKDPLFIRKLTTKESLEYWIKLIVEGYMRLYENKTFTKSNIVEDYNIQYHEENNPYLLYLSDMKSEDFIDEPVKEISDDCEMWCENNDIKYSKKMFYETLKEIMRVENSGTRRINGVVNKVFKAID